VLPVSRDDLLLQRRRSLRDLKRDRGLRQELARLRFRTHGVALCSPIRDASGRSDNHASFGAGLRSRLPTDESSDHRSAYATADCAAAPPLRHCVSSQHRDC
jgi:hypothetical protein